MIDAEREKSAKISRDNKLLRTKIQKTVEQNEKLVDEIRQLESTYSKREAEMKSKLDELQRTRLEWEKCAITYKTREKKYVAEIRKQETDYEKLQQRLARRITPLVGN